MVTRRSETVSTSKPTTASPTPPCRQLPLIDPDNPEAPPADPVLAHAFERYNTGKDLVGGRLVDDVAELYVDDRCFIYEVYNHARCEPAAEPGAATNVSLPATANVRALWTARLRDSGGQALPMVPFTRRRVHVDSPA